MLIKRGLAVVLGDFAEMGYDALWGVLGADNAGAPHKRKRIWILAYTQCNSERPCFRERFNGNAVDKQNNREKLRNDTSDSRCPSWWEKDPADFPHSYSLKGNHERDGKSQNERKAEEKISNSNGIGKIGHKQKDRKGCRLEQEDGRPVESFMGRVAYGVAHRVDRLKAIGNGQVPAVVELAWKILNKIREEEA